MCVFCDYSFTVDDIDTCRNVVYDIDTLQNPPGISIDCENCPDERIWYDAYGQGFCLHCFSEETFNDVK
jgi:hypothetical protein